MSTRLLFGLLASRVRPHATEDRPPAAVEKIPQRVGLDRGEGVYKWIRCLAVRRLCSSYIETRYT
jgi:hypothetical protein